MTPPIKNVILIGAQGSIGAAIFKSLLASPQFSVSVLSRVESTSSYPAHIKVIKSDYSEASLIDAFTGQDAVVSALGSHGLAQEIKIIDAAAKAGVKRFLPSEYGSNTLNTKGADLVPVFAIKLAAIEHLKKQEGKGMSWTAIPAGPAFDLGLQIGLLGFNINNNSAVIFDGGNRPFSTSNVSQIGNSVVAVLSKPEETANQVLYVHSFTTTQNEVLKALEKATGKTWDVTESTTEVAAKEGAKLFSEGDFTGLLLLLKAIFLGEGYGSDFTNDAILANVKLGLPEQDLSDTVQALVAGNQV